MNHQKDAERLAALEAPSAQTHALLAIAEQLRVVNLIALGNAEYKSNADAIFDEDQELNWPLGILAAQISEALGIEQP